MLDQLDPPATDAFSVFKTSIVTLRDVHQVIDADLKRVLKLETGQKGICLPTCCETLIQYFAVQAGFRWCLRIWPK